MLQETCSVIQWQPFRPTRMISSGFQIAGFGVKVCRHHPFRVTAFRLQRACYGTNFPSSCCHSHVGMLWVPHFTPTLSQMRWYLIMRRGLAYWISVSLPYICLPFQKAGLFASHPLLPPNEPCNFLCEMALYLEICHAYSGDGGDPSPKVRVFCNSRWPDTSKILNKPLPISHKNRKTTIIKRCSEWDCNPSNALSSFWNVQWTKEHPGEWQWQPRIRWILNLGTPPRCWGIHIFFFHLAYIFIFLT